MDIQQIDDDKKGAFLVKEEGKTKAEMSYVWSGVDRIIIDHTEVDDSLRGKGVGMQLFKEMAAFAKEKGLKVIPLCPFAKSVFDRFPEEYEAILST